MLNQRTCRISESTSPNPLREVVKIAASVKIDTGSGISPFRDLLPTTPECGTDYTFRCLSGGDAASSQ